MELKKIFRDYEEGITVWETEDKVFQALEGETDGSFFLYQKEKGSNSLVYTGIRAKNKEECENMIKMRYTYRIWM